MEVILDSLSFSFSLSSFYFDWINKDLLLQNKFFFSRFFVLFQDTARLFNQDNQLIILPLIGLKIIHSYIHLYIHSFFQSIDQSFIHPLIEPFIRSFVLFFYSSNNSLNYIFIYQSNQPYNHPSFHLLIYLILIILMFLSPFSTFHANPFINNKQLSSDST